MGTWGVAIFSDDLAADLREDFRDLIGEGITPTEAVNRLLDEYESSVNDPDEHSIFWIALAAIQWKLGRLEERTKQEAIRVITTGTDLERWPDPKMRRKREAALERLHQQLLLTPPEPKRVPRRIKSANDWKVGEIVGLRLASGKLVLMRVIGHHTDKGGRDAVCELLDWIGDAMPSLDVIAKLPIRTQPAPPGNENNAWWMKFGRKSQFLVAEPRKKNDQARILRTEFISVPAQECGGYTVLVWGYVDQQLNEWFNLE